MNRLTFTVGDVVSKDPCLDGLGRMTKNLGPFTGPTELNLLTPTENTPRDLLWGLGLTQLSDLEQKTIAVKVAVFVARGGLHLFEAKYPKDRRHRQAIEAAEACVLAEFSEESMAAARAAGAVVYAVSRAASRASRAAGAAGAAGAAAAAAYAAYAVGADPRVEPKIKAYLIKLLEDYK